MTETLNQTVRRPKRKGLAAAAAQDTVAVAVAM